MDMIEAYGELTDKLGENWDLPSVCVFNAKC